MLHKPDFLLLSLELQNALKQSFGFTVLVGAELEFYLNCDQHATSSILESALGYCTRVEEEKGWQQFEFVFEETTDIEELASSLNTAKYFAITEARKLGGKALFDAKPFPDDYGSGLHFHASLHNTYMSNVFGDHTIDTNDILKHSISGILSLAQASLCLLCPQEEDYSRFAPNFMAPTHVSWGGNNRTTLIRIPDSDIRNRRIEYRLPAASSDPAVGLFIMLLSIWHGLTNQPICVPRTYGNAWDPYYNLEQLPLSLAAAKNLFENSDKIPHYINKFSHIITK